MQPDRTMLGYDIPSSRPRHEHLVLWTAGALLATRLVLALTLIPPWQQPDEPTHVAIAELQKHRLASMDIADPAREKEILLSMAEHRFWEHRATGFPVPTSIPERFTDADPRVAVGNTANRTRPSLYFRVAGRLLTWLGHDSVTEDLYALRVLSALFAVLTFLVAWAGARACLGPFGGCTVALLVALHPQFAAVSASASPDPLIYLLGASVWWQAVVAIRGSRRLLALAIVWLAAFVAAISDRVGVPLLAIALVATLLSLCAPGMHLWRRRTVTFGLIAAIATVVAGTSIWFAVTTQDTFGWPRTLTTGDLFAPGALTASFFARFTAAFHHTWWYALGWGRYTPPAWWIAVAVALTLIAASGLLRRWRKIAVAAPTRTVLMLAVASVGIQVAAVYWAFFRLGNGPQGRYVFPVVVPTLILLWVGLKAWIPQSPQMCAAAVVLLFAVLDMAAWLLVVIPAYYGSF